MGPEVSCAEMDGQPISPALSACHDNIEGCEAVLSNVLDRVRGQQGGKLVSTASPPPDRGTVGSVNRLRDRIMSLQRSLNELNNYI